MGPTILLFQCNTVHDLVYLKIIFVLSARQVRLHVLTLLDKRFDPYLVLVSFNPQTPGQCNVNITYLTIYRVSMKRGLLAS